MPKVQNFNKVNRKENLEDVLIVGDKAYFYWKEYPNKAKPKEWRYSEEWAIFCNLIHQPVEETPLILSGNLLNAEIIKGLEIAAKQTALSIIFLDDVTEAQKSAIFFNLATKTKIKEIKVFDKNCVIQDIKRDYLLTLRNNEQILKIEESRTKEEHATDEPILIKTAKPAEIKFADNGAKKGFFLMEEGNSGINYHWLSDKFEVIGQGVEIEEGNKHYSMIRFQANGKTGEVTEAILQGELASAETFKNLRNKGLEINYITKHHPYLANYISAKTIGAPKWRIVSSSGWHNGAYIYPNGEIIGEMENKQPLFLRNQPINSDLFNQSCTLAEWQENVVKYAKGNDFIILALLFALSAPVVSVIENAPHFGIHIYGDSGSGKSTCSYIANSVYGHGKGIERSWSTTRTALINEAISRNDCLLVMDEMTTMSQDLGAGVFYELFQGVEKLRGQADKEQNRRVRTWRTLVLSNGERNYEDQLREIFREKHFKAKTGELVRMLNISFLGLSNFHQFENDPNYPTDYHKSLAFADLIKINSGKFYGVAGREWIKFIMNNTAFLDIEHSKNERLFIDKMIAAKPKGVDEKELNQVGRVAKNFALLVTVGKCSKHITGFTDNEVEKAIFNCFMLWANEFGWGNKEKMQIIDNLDLFIQQNIGDLYHVKDKKIIGQPISKKFVGFYVEEDTRENSYLILDKRNLMAELGAFPEKKIIESLIKEKRLIRTEKKDKDNWRNDTVYPSISNFNGTTPTKRGLKITLPRED